MDTAIAENVFTHRETEDKPALQGSGSEFSICCHYMRSEAPAMLCTKINMHLSTNYAVTSFKTAMSCVHTHQSHNVVFSVDTSVCKGLTAGHVYLR